MGCWGLGCPGLEGVQLRAAAGLSHTRTRGGDGAACHSPKRPDAPGISAGLRAEGMHPSIPTRTEQHRALQVPGAHSARGADSRGGPGAHRRELLHLLFVSLRLWRGSSCCPSSGSSLGVCSAVSPTQSPTSKVLTLGGSARWELPKGSTASPASSRALPTRIPNLPCLPAPGTPPNPKQPREERYSERRKVGSAQAARRPARSARIHAASWQARRRAAELSSVCPSPSSSRSG